MGNIVYAEGDLKFGQMNSGGRAVDGQMDAIAFFDEVLTDDQVATMFYTAGSSEYPLARGPNPKDGALHSGTWVNLSWSAGRLSIWNAIGPSSGRLLVPFRQSGDRHP